MRVRLFVGDDWAEDHHDIEEMDEAGKVLAKRRVPEGPAGMTQLHALVGRFLPENADDVAPLARRENRHALATCSACLRLSIMGTITSAASASRMRDHITVQRRDAHEDRGTRRLQDI
jgi:hypothetical protein